MSYSANFFKPHYLLPELTHDNILFPLNYYYNPKSYLITIVAIGRREYLISY